MTHSIRLACVSVALVACGAAPQAVLYAQENGQCAFLCAPELKIEPTFTIENLFNPARVETIEDGGVVETMLQGRDRVFELVFAADVPTEIPRVGFTLEAIFSPFRDDTEVELELELNLWVANYYSARNPLRLSSLVILGVVARMFRCASRSSCWCT